MGRGRCQSPGVRGTVPGRARPGGPRVSGPSESAGVTEKATEAEPRPGPGPVRSRYPAAVTACPGHVGGPPGTQVVAAAVQVRRTVRARAGGPGHESRVPAQAAAAALRSPRRPAAAPGPAVFKCGRAPAGRARAQCVNRDSPGPGPGPP